MRPILLLVLFASAVIADSAPQVLADMEKELAASQQAKGTATCTLDRPDIRPHHAHGKLPLDFLQHLVLANEQVKYSLRYWLNIATADAQTGASIEGSTGLGMDLPNAVNWYNNNFLEFTYGGKQILQQSMAKLAVEAKGDRAVGTVTWDVPEARVVLEFSLAGDADAIELRCQVEAKGEPQPVRLGFRAYPGHTAPPRARRVVTSQRELQPEIETELAPAETTLVLFDEAEPHLPCAIRFAGAGQAKAQLSLESYGVTVHLEYAPVVKLGTGPILLWDFRNVSLNETLDRLLAANTVP